jgi:hypothetical protein
MLLPPPAKPKANGQKLRWSEDDNADLFWAVRGGGGNFGVAASFEFVSIQSDR